MPTQHQYETVKQQCLAFESIGFKTELRTLGLKDEASPAVTVNLSGKIYKFSDPDWNIVITQLACLYKNIQIDNKQFSSYIRQYLIKKYI